MNEAIIDILVQRLEEAEQQLSDEAYEYLHCSEGVEDIFVYKKVLGDYSKLLKDRFWCDPEDEQDAETINKMLQLINALVNAMTKQRLNDDNIIVIDIDE